MAAQPTPTSPAPRPTDPAFVELVYEQLRRQAQLAMAMENPGHTLQATALVHEVFLRLAQGRNVPWANKAHFYAAAAESMSRLLIDHARAKQAQKRGGGNGAGPVDGASCATDLIANVADLATAENPETILRLAAGISRLEAENPEAAALVRLRFYAGLSLDQTAEALGLSPATVDRRWAFARAWLHRHLSEPPAQAGE